MKNIFLFILSSLLVCGGFISCGDSDDPVIGEAVKEMIKGKWNVTSNYMKSNSSEMDRLMNELLGAVLQQSTISMIFKQETVETTLTIKTTGQTEVVNEKYYFQDYKLYVIDEDNGPTEIYNYNIYQKRMDLTMEVSRNDLIELISESFEGTGLGEEIIARIPSNYTGRVVMEFRR